MNVKSVLASLSLRQLTTIVSSRSAMVVPLTWNNGESMFRRNLILRTSKDVDVPVESVYLDTMPHGSCDCGTVLMLHGAPGSHKDFKYVIPYLMKQNIRVIAINFPGMGYSSHDDRLLDDSVERDQFIQQTISDLKLGDKLVVLGHSRGCADALNISAKYKSKVLGVVLANTLGFRPHRAVRPLWTSRLVNWLWSFKSMRFFIKPLITFYFKMAKFRVTTEIGAIVIRTIAHTVFANIRQPIDVINQTNIRVIVAYSGKDALVETAVSHEVVNAFDCITELRCTSIGDENEIIDATTNALNAGQQHLSIYFEKENHFLQKYRAKFLARSIETILSLNNEDSNGLKSKI